MKNFKSRHHSDKYEVRRQEKKRNRKLWTEGNRCLDQSLMMETRLLKMVNVRLIVSKISNLLIRHNLQTIYEF